MFLVMMVLTRTMPEEDSRGPTNQSVVIGNASDSVLRPARRRKRNAITTTGKYHIYFIHLISHNILFDPNNIIFESYIKITHIWFYHGFVLFEYCINHISMMQFSFLCHFY